MSGNPSSGGGSGGGGSGPGDSPPDCASLVFKTILSSPVPAVVRTLKVGDVLKVVAQTTTGPVVAQDGKGKIAGSITHPFLDKLLECLNKGKLFVADVVRLDKGLCEVEVRPK